MSHSVEVCLLFKMKILLPYLIVVISVCDFWHKILFCDLNCSFSFNHWMLLEKVLKPSIKGISWIIFLLVSGSGLEVSVLVIYSNDPSSYPTAVKSFYSAIILNRANNYQSKRGLLQTISNTNLWNLAALKKITLMGCQKSRDWLVLTNQTALFQYSITTLLWHLLMISTPLLAHN